MLNPNTPAPDFIGVNQLNTKVSLNEFKGKTVLLYFYPKDDTPGCTKEACSLRDNFDELQKHVEVIGVSADDVESHKEFIEKYHLPFTLLADKDRKIIKAYEANGSLGTKRISYLIDPQGVILKAYPNVNPSQHAEEILQDVKNL